MNLILNLEWILPSCHRVAVEPHAKSPRIVDHSGKSVTLLLVEWMWMNGTQSSAFLPFAPGLIRHMLGGALISWCCLFGWNLLKTQKAPATLPSAAVFLFHVPRSTTPTILWCITVTDLFIYFDFWDFLVAWCQIINALWFGVVWFRKKSRWCSNMRTVKGLFHDRTLVILDICTFLKWTGSSLHTAISRLINTRLPVSVRDLTTLWMHAFLCPETFSFSVQRIWAGHVTGVEMHSGICRICKADRNFINQSLYKYENIHYAGYKHFHSGCLSFCLNGFSVWPVQENKYKYIYYTVYYSIR